MYAETDGKVERDAAVALNLLIDSWWPDCNANLYLAGLRLASGGWGGDLAFYPWVFFSLRTSIFDQGLPKAQPLPLFKWGLAALPFA